MSSGRRSLRRPAVVWLTERDEELIRDVVSATVMTRDQVLALGYFSSLCRANTRLKELCQHGYLRRVEGTRLGSRQTLYAGDAKAASVVAPSMEKEEKEVAKRLRQAPGLLFLEHTLRITDVRIAALRSIEAYGGTWRFWLYEAQCFHSYQLAAHLPAQVIKPDAFVRIDELPKSARSDWFVEVDMGTVSVARFQRKLEAYKQYLESGTFTETYRRDRFGLVLACRDAKRKERLIRGLDVSWTSIAFWSFEQLELCCRDRLQRIGVEHA